MILKRKQNKCEGCGEVFASPIQMTRCWNCAEKAVASEIEKADCEAQEARRRAFWVGVPPLYRKTDKARLKPVLAQIVESWEYGPQGVGFVGSAGAGKTRAAVLLLEKANEADKSTLYISATELSACAAALFSDDPKEKNEAKSKLARTKTVKCLLIDDLGKGRLTDRAESELYDILEHRTSHELPTIWTSNSNAQGLRSMFSQDRSDALIRRLGKEFCQHVTL